MSNYVTLAEAKAWLDLTDTSLDAQVQLALDAAEAEVENYCGRVFTSSTDTRIFPATKGRWLVVDDVTDVTLVEMDASGDGVYETTVTDWVLAPFNAAASGKPYTHLFRRTADWIGIVRVTGTWGWPAVPKAVKQAVLFQTARILKRRESPFGVASVSLDGAPLRLASRMDPDAERALAPYRRVFVR